MPRSGLSHVYHVYLTSISCLAHVYHVYLMSIPCLSHVSLMSISCLSHVYLMSIMSILCQSHVYLMSIMSCLYFAHVSLTSRSCLGPGLSLSQVDAGGDGLLVGSTGSRAYCLRTAYARAFKGAGSVSWSALPAYSLKYYSCGLYGCWGVDTIGRVFHTRVRPSS